MHDARKNPWTKLSSKIVHTNPWYQVRQDKVLKPDGNDGYYNVIDSPAAVFSVAIDEKQRVYLVGIYRYPSSLYSLEVPSGGSENQNPLEAAKRELQEETGLVAAKWKKLGTIYPAGGFLNQPNHIYLATQLKNTNQHRQAEEGISEVLVLPISKVLTMIRQNKITDAQSIAALTLAAMELKILSA